MSKDYVTHKGTVRNVEENVLVVSTDEAGQCEGCAITALCNKAPDERELLNIETPDAASFKAGDRVEAVATSGSTLAATWWALLLPTVIFLGVTVGLTYGIPSLGGWAIAIGFGALAAYDLVLYMMRRRIARKIIWKVKKIQ